MNTIFPQEHIFNHLVIEKLGNEDAIRGYFSKIKELKEEMEFPLDRMNFMRETKNKFKKEADNDGFEYYKNEEKRYAEEVERLKKSIKEIEKEIETLIIENKFIKRTLNSFDVKDKIESATKSYIKFKNKHL